MNEHLRRALDALETGAAEARGLSARSTEGVRRRLQQTVEEVLEHLEKDSEEPEDVMSSLDRQAKDIADDLRRAERLMKKRMGQE
jgi:ABC-type transporter Mla subunit MlaD